MGAPSFSGRGGGGGQDRARGVPFDSREYIFHFRPIQPARGGCCPLLADLTSVCVCVCCPLLADLTSGGGGGCCPLSADSISEVSTLSADPAILSVGGGCCPLSVRMYVNFYYKGGGGGGHGPPWGRP